MEGNGSRGEERVRWTELREMEAGGEKREWGKMDRAEEREGKWQAFSSL